MTMTQSMTCSANKTCFIEHFSFFTVQKFVFKKNETTNGTENKLPVVRQSWGGSFGDSAV